MKQTHLKIKDPKFDYDVNSIQHEQANPSKEAWIQKCQKLLKEVGILNQTFFRTHSVSDLFHNGRRINSSVNYNRIDLGVRQPPQGGQSSLDQGQDFHHSQCQ